MEDHQRDALGAALGRVPSGLFIVTVRAGDQATAFLASWVQQASFDPPTLSVAIQNDRHALALCERGTFAVNIITKGDKSLMKHFGRGFPPGAACYEGLPTEVGTTGVEVLPGALGWLECRPTGRLVAGDHTLVLGTIVAGRLNVADGEPAVWTRKSGFGY